MGNRWVEKEEERIKNWVTVESVFVYVEMISFMVWVLFLATGSYMAEVEGIHLV